MKNVDIETKNLRSRLNSKLEGWGELYDLRIVINSLCLSVLICKVGIIIVPILQGWCIKINRKHQNSALVSSQTVIIIQSWLIKYNYLEHPYMAAFSKCVAQKVSPVRCSEEKKYSMMKYFGKSYITLTISQRFTVDITILKTLRSSAVKKPVQPCHLYNKKDDETDTHGGSVTWQNSSW